MPDDKFLSASLIFTTMSSLCPLILMILTFAKLLFSEKLWSKMERMKGRLVALEK